jgi:hypothetical protein
MGAGAPISVFSHEHAEFNNQEAGAKDRRDGMPLGTCAGGWVNFGLGCRSGVGTAALGSRASTRGPWPGRCVVLLFALAIWEDAQSKDIERLLRGSFLGCLGGLFSDLQLFGVNGVDNEALRFGSTYEIEILSLEQCFHRLLVLCVGPVARCFGDPEQAI